MSSTLEWLFKGQDWLESLGYWTLPAYIGIYLIATLVGLPGVFLFVAAGSMFGWLKGSIVVSVADTLSISLCYVLGRTIARKAIKNWLARRPRFAHLDRAVEKKGWKIVLLTRMSPILPSNILNYSFSLTKINFWHYLLASWLGMLPAIALYVYLGSVGVNLIEGQGNPAQTILSVSGIITTVIALIYTTKLAQKILSEAANSEQSDR
jgi:uncharacterized membrane protein YdjX (TVP38/TMEM64 family)